ncbi:MAG TPA: cation:proton antiporter [Vicinamibacterales bacterium]|jgi:Kef-type K+ transport system membrane component KefB
MLLHLLAALAAVVLLGRFISYLFRGIGQPPVIGEVVAGIMLGPSLLGRVWPDAYGFLLPSSVAPSLNLLSQLGVVLYMFLVGVELDTSVFRGRLRATVFIALTGIAVPFALGAGLATRLFPRLSPAGVAESHFVLFLGIAMSITAFPVLARILADRGITRTPLGRLSLTCAAVADVTAWCLLALVVGVVQSKGGGLLTTVLTFAFIGLMFAVVRPAVMRLLQRWDEREPDRGVIAIALVAVLLSAIATEAIGVHAIFGAFLLGAVIPHDSRLARALEQRIEHLVTILLLPAFFAFAGMRTEIGLLTGVDAWLTCASLIVVATVGKFGGTLLAARFTGQDWRQAAGLGILMNTRGLMELIVLNLGLDLGIISPALFTMMVIMALVTTMATTPLLLAVQGSGFRVPVPDTTARRERP